MAFSIFEGHLLDPTPESAKLRGIEPGWLVYLGAAAARSAEKTGPARRVESEGYSSHRNDENPTKEEGKEYLRLASSSAHRPMARVNTTCH